MSDKSQERLDLERRADKAGVEYPWNLGDDKLRERVEEAEAAKAAETPVATAQPSEPSSSAPQAPEQTAQEGGPDGAAAESEGAVAAAPSQPAAPDVRLNAGTQAAPDGATPPDPETPPFGLVVRVTGPRKGRWRAGRFFTRETVEIPLEELTEDEKAALIADPKLTVETVEED